MPLADGQVFAGYTILRVLGTGGMGEVYLAEHPRLPRRDALKVLGTEVSHDAEYRQRFNQEAEMVATLRHPNIVTIYDRGDSDGQLWIAMEFVDGTDAFRLMSEQYRTGVPAEQVVHIVTAVADALDYAHSRDVLHRDIKPANILLGRSGSGIDPVMLADFGVARWAGQHSDLTGTEATVGTVTYASPEQLTGQEIDGRADQYALAATAYHLMTGSAPFTNSNPAVVIGQHLGSTPPVIGAHRPDLSAFGPVFAKALAKKPADRYRNCRDFAAAMQQALAPVGPASGRHHRASAPTGRRRWLAVGLGALVLLGAIAAAALTAGLRGPATSAPTTITTAPPPPAVAARMDLPVVVLGADCAVLGAAAVTETGAPAYCARSVMAPDPAGADPAGPDPAGADPAGPDPAGADPATPDSAGAETVWSPQPERLRTATPPTPAAP
jgi:serine/threonine-protein kinase